MVGPLIYKYTSGQAEQPIPIVNQKQNQGKTRDQSPYIHIFILNILQIHHWQSVTDRTVINRALRTYGIEMHRLKTSVRQFNQNESEYLCLLN